MNVSTVVHSSYNYRQLQVELYNQKTPDVTKMNKPKTDFKFPLKGQLQRKFFISINELWLYQITIYVIKSL